MSVTYGAGGSTRELTRDLVVRLKGQTSLDPFPHLTCVCHQEAEIRAIIEEELEAVWEGKVPPKLALDRAAERGNVLLRKFEREHRGAAASSTPAKGTPKAAKKKEK